MKWILRGLLVLVALVALIYVVGLLRPAGHVASTRATYAAAPQALWDVLADLASWSEWNPDIRKMTRLPDRDGRETWMATGAWGELPTQIVRAESPRLLETFVDGGAFQGSWTYELSPAGDGTELTITERGEVSSPFFRAMMIFNDNFASMRSFHAALSGRLGERVEVVELGES